MLKPVVSWRLALRTALAVAVALAGGAAAALAPPRAAYVAPPTIMLDACSWDHPGVNPFMGDVVGAVDRYQDIPPEIRARLKARMARREYDDIVSIRRDSIDGQAGQKYSNVISDMHFGTHQVCRSVTRASWTTAMQERGLVYCESGRCILVPTVCRNVSRVSRKGVSPEHVEAPEAIEAPDVADIPEAVPPGNALAGPFGDPTPGPIALDESPSFAALGAPAQAGGAVGNGVGAVAPPIIGAAPPFPGAGTATSGGSLETGPVAAVPEPQTWALMGLGLALLGAVRRRRGR